MARHGAIAEGPSSREAGSGTSSEQNPRRVAVVVEPGRRGTSALAHAARLVAERPTELTVLVLAPQEPPPRCGGASPDAYNCAVLDQVSSELHDAARRLGGAGDGARFRMLIERRDPPLATWIAQTAIELVLLPARRRGLRSLRHPEARRIRRHALAEVRVVSPGPR
jgi:hypothetical protein